MGVWQALQTVVMDSLRTSKGDRTTLKVGNFPPLAANLARSDKGVSWGLALGASTTFSSEVTQACFLCTQFWISIIAGSTLKREL